MKSDSKIIFIVLFLIVSFNTMAQNCDCTIIPVKSGCEKECGLYILKNGTDEQLVKVLNVDKLIAKKITQIPKRKTFKSINEFKQALPENDFKELEIKYNNFLSPLTIQNNQSGNNFNGGQTIQTQFTGNPFVLINNPNIDSIKFEIEKGKKEIRIAIGNYYISGCALRDRCWRDTALTILDNESNIWYQEVLNYLTNNLDYSYVAQFSTPKLGVGISYGIRQEFEALFSGLNNRVSILYDFISTLR